MNIKYPLCREAYELSLLIEKLPASKEQTDASSAASDLGRHIEDREHHVENLVLLVRRLVNKCADVLLCANALDYLNRTREVGSVLRDEALATKEQA